MFASSVCMCVGVGVGGGGRGREDSGVVGPSYHILVVTWTLNSFALYTNFLVSTKLTHTHSSNSSIALSEHTISSLF